MSHCSELTVVLVFAACVLNGVLLIRPLSAALPSPVQCSSDGCTLANYQGVWVDRTPCKAAKVMHPSNESELLSCVAEAVKKNLKVKVVTESSHSVSKIACPGGDDGLLISTRDYVSDQIVVDKLRLTATINAGTPLRHFVRRLAEHGLTIPHTPLWDGVSVGGVISTGSHGSGFYLKGGVISEYVTSLRFIVPAPPENDYAKVVEITSSDKRMKAAKISLGVLGVISTVTFSVLPMFKRSVTLDLVDDDDLEQYLLQFSKAHAFSSLFWVPSTGKVILKKEDRISVETLGEGVNLFPLVQPMRVSQAEGMRTHQEHIESTRDVASLCKWGEQLVQHRMRSGDGYLNLEGAPFEGFPVVGFNHRMQTVGGCQVSPPDVEVAATRVEMLVGNMSDQLTCKWNPNIRGVFYYHTSISIPLSKTADFILDVKRLREANPEGMCSLNMFGGIHVRFVGKSEAYLGVKEDAAVFEMVYFRTRERGVPRLNEDVMEELEQMLLFKYGGNPHWGKNRELAFEGVHEKVVDVAKFLKVKKTMDPEGLFSSEWTDELLGLRKRTSTAKFSTEGDDFCALEGLCVCSEDRHCAPNKGYFCLPGLVFQHARVCRYDPQRPQYQ